MDLLIVMDISTRFFFIVAKFLPFFNVEYAENTGNLKKSSKIWHKMKKSIVRKSMDASSHNGSVKEAGEFGHNLITSYCSIINIITEDILWICARVPKKYYTA